MTQAPEIDVEGFAQAHGTGAYVIDVREPDEYFAGHVPGARLIPLGSVAGAAGALPQDERVYVVCRSGGRSLSAANALRAAGYDAVSVAGGTIAWVTSGRPVVTGNQPD